MKFIVPMLMLTTAAIAQQNAPKPKPLVMIKGDGNILFMRGSETKHDQTIEMAKQLIKHCPQVELVVADSELTPDYELVLNREGGGFLDTGDSQIMLLRGKEHTIMWTSDKPTVAKAMKASCERIMDDWKGAPKAGAASATDGWWHNSPPGQPHQ